MDLIQRVIKARVKHKEFPEFRTGDTVGVYVRVKEGEKERVQLYKGVVLKIQGAGASKTFTVRKISSGVGVERTFPFSTPSIDRVEVIAHGQVRRGRLFYLRGLKGRAARLNSELAMVVEGEEVGAADEVAVEEPTTETAKTPETKEKSAKK